jgi:AcrR family transcriptional regulator
MQARSEETHRKILSRSAKLFSEKGYDATGVAEICAASEVSKGAFYHHFPTKQAVFIELLKEWLGDLDTELGKAFSDSASVPQGLLAMTGRIKGVFSTANAQGQLFFEFWQQARREPAVWKAFIAPYRRYQDYFAGIVRKGIKEGSIRKVDPSVAGKAMVALAVGMIVQGMVDPDGTPWDKVTRDAVTLLIEGMSPDGRTARSGRR